MAGYANRIITLTFPELTEDGDELIKVVIRNPKTVPPEEMRAAGQITSADAERLQAGPDGEIAAGAVTGEDMNRGFAVMAKLVIGWRVYDATVVGDDQPLMGLPATAESIGKLPMEIVNALGDEIAKVNPPVPQEGTTSRTS